MDPMDQGKLFIGGISWETGEDRLREYFGKYGEVVQAVVMRDKVTNRPRGFAFVAFADPAVLDRVLQDKHTIDGRTVEAKRALSREEQHTSGRPGNPTVGRASGGAVSGNIRTKKIFVGGLPPNITEDGFRQYFENYGSVTDAVVMYDQNTHRPRGFGFVSFDSEDAVDRVLHKTFHDLNGKMVEVKRALPKDANPGSTGGSSTGGGAYQSYGATGNNSSSYDSRAETNRYMQPQSGSGYPPYGSSGYGGPSYGYGAANNGVGYGGYGVSGYGSGAGGAYGNTNVPSAAYMSGPPGAPRSPWGNQPTTGYGSAGYGASAPYGPNAGYGALATWNAGTPGGGPAAAPIGQPPSGNTGYGSIGYGYGGYGGSEGPYHGNHGSYGAIGGRGGGPAGNNASGSSGDQGSGYMGGGGFEGNGNPGYSNSWRSDASQGGSFGASQVNGPSGGGPAGYGGGYGGGSQTRPNQP